MSKRAIALGILASVAAGCATHEARPAFRRGITIADRGISVPLPPPSFMDAISVEVDVEGSTPGDEALEVGTIIHVEDLEGDARESAEIDIGSATFEVRGLMITLGAHCLELWIEAPDGRESERTYVHAEVEDDTTIRTEAGCD